MEPEITPISPAPPIVPDSPKSKPKRPLILAGILVVALVLGVLIVFWLKNKQPAEQAATTPKNNVAEIPVEDVSTIRMLATGDFIAHDAINNAAKTGTNYDYSSMMTGMKSYFSGSDINFCNQATLAGGAQFGITGYPIFNAPIEWISGMEGLGCNVINTGTNHTNDKGQGPISAQLSVWDQRKTLAVAGANRNKDEQNKVRYFDVKGLTFAFLSYSTYSNSPNPNPYSLNRFNDELVIPQMTEARQKADIIIVSMRWGTEYSAGINVAQEAAAKKLTDLGADVILGHGPHVLEPVKRLSGTLLDGTAHESIVWYSLGNFLNAQLETEALTGCVATFTFDVASKKLTDSTCLPFYQHYEWTAEEKAAEDLLARKNFQIMPLFEAEQLIGQSQLGTTVEAQMQRISELVNTYTKVSVQNAQDL